MQSNLYTIYLYMQLYIYIYLKIFKNQNCSMLIIGDISCVPYRREKKNVIVCTLTDHYLIDFNQINVNRISLEF